MNDTVPATITTWEEADLALGEIRTRRERVKLLASTFDAQVKAIEEARAKACAEDTAAINELEARLRDFGRQNVAGIVETRKGTRSRKLVHGVIGLRTSTPKLDFIESEAHAIKMLKVRNHLDCIQTTEKVLKERARELPATELRLCGMEVSQAEAIYCKLNGAEVVSLGGDTVAGEA